MRHSQIVAVVRDRKVRSTLLLEQVTKAAAQREHFAGLSRTYHPLAEGEPAQPAEFKRPALTVTALLATIKQPLILTLDTVRTQDQGNMSAVANVSLSFDGRSLSLTAVPATHLLFLEHQCDALLAMANAMPTLNPVENWKRDDATGDYRSDPHRQTRTKKVAKPIIMVAPTKEHPGQAQLVTEDIPVGEYEAVQLSGAVPETYRAKIHARITALKEAIIAAREEANSIETIQQTEGKEIMDFIFGE